MLFLKYYSSVHYNILYLVKAMVFPVVMYGCESWTVKKAEPRRIDAFELLCWRRLLRVPWTARPLAWLVVVTFTAGWQKIFSPLPAVGFLAQADKLQTALDAGAVAAAKVAEAQALIFNARLDAVVC